MVVLLSALGLSAALPPAAMALGAVLAIGGAAFVWAVRAPGSALLLVGRTLYWHAAAIAVGLVLVLQARQGWAYYAYAGVVLTFWIEAASLQARDAPAASRSLAFARRNAVLLATLAAVLLIWGLYLAAYYPGIMSTDSINEWTQALSFKLSDYSPAIYTLFLWAAGTLWRAPAVAATVQLVVSALSVAWLAAYLDRRGVARWVLALGLAIYLVLPIFGTFTVTLWHDIPYSLIVLWVTHAMYELYVTKGDWLRVRWRGWALGASLVLLPLFAHNGLSVVCGVLVGSWIVLRRYRRAVGWIAAGVVVGFLSVEYLVYPVIGVQPLTKEFASEALLHQVSAAITQHGVQGLPSKDVAYLVRIMPLKDWTQKYNPYTPQFLVSQRFNPSFNETPIDQHFGEFLSVWATLGMKYPGSYVMERVTENALVLDATGSHRIALSPLGVEKNSIGLRTTSLAPALRSELISIAKYTTDKMLWLWRAFWVMWLLVALTIAGYFLRGRSILFAAIPWVFQVLGLAISIQGQSVRYYYSLFLILPYFIGIVTLPRRGMEASLVRPLAQRSAEAAPPQ